MNLPFEAEDLGITVPARRRAWPFHLVLDVSQSMWDERWEGQSSPHTVMQESLSLMYDSLSLDPMVKDICWLEVTTFAEEPTAHFPSTPINTPHKMPPLRKGSWTNYVGVWEYLARTIPAGVRKLQLDGYVLSQPIVFFVTDGRAGGQNIDQPISSWKPSHDALCDRGFAERPRIISLGMGSVDAATVLALRSVDPAGPACIADPGQPASLLLKAIMTMIVHSIRTSANKGRFEFQVPKGMTRIDKD